MSVLTVGELRQAIKGLPKNTVVIIGDDDELNGVHNAWNAQVENTSSVIVKSFAGSKMYEAIIMEEFEVHLGHTKEKTNTNKVLVIF